MGHHVVSRRGLFLGLGILLLAATTAFYLAILAAYGFGMDYLLRLLQRRLCPWFEEGR